MLKQLTALCVSAALPACRVMEIVSGVYWRIVGQVWRAVLPGIHLVTINIGSRWVLSFIKMLLSVPWDSILQFDAKSLWKHGLFLHGLQFRDQSDLQRSMFVSIRLDLLENVRVLNFVCMQSRLFFCIYLVITGWQTIALVLFNCANCRDKAELPAICDCSVNIWKIDVIGWQMASSWMLHAGNDRTLLACFSVPLSSQMALCTAGWLLM